MLQNEGQWHSFRILMKRFPPKAIPTQWIQRCVNIFADDLQSGDTFGDERELGLRLECLGLVVDGLGQLGLTVNSLKTVAMLQLADSRRRKWQSQLVHRVANGAYLLLPRKSGPLRIKLVSSVVYLGVHVSFSAFEVTTQAMRTSAACSSTVHLSRWLYSKRRLPLRTRLVLWQTCVVPCAEYGLLAVGVTAQSLHRHVTSLIKQLRIITGNQSHHTHDSHLTVLRSLGLERPIESLRRAAQARIGQHAVNIQKVNAGGIAVTHSVSSLAESQRIIARYCEELYARAPLVTPDLPPGLYEAPTSH